MKTSTDILADLNGLDANSPIVKYAAVMRSRKQGWFIIINARGVRGSEVTPDRTVTNENNEVVLFDDDVEAMNYYQLHIASRAEVQYYYRGEPIFNVISKAKNNGKFHLMYLSAETATTKFVKDDEGNPIIFDNERAMYDYVDKHIIKPCQTALSVQEIRPMTGAHKGSHASGDELLELIGKFLNSPQHTNDCSRIFNGDYEQLDEIIYKLVMLKYNPDYGDLPIEWRLGDCGRHESLDYPLQRVDDTSSDEEVMDYLRLLANDATHINRKIATRLDLMKMMKSFVNKD